MTVRSVSLGISPMTAHFENFCDALKEKNVHEKMVER